MNPRGVQLNCLLGLLDGFARITFRHVHGTHQEVCLDIFGVLLQYKNGSFLCLLGILASEEEVPQVQLGVDVVLVEGCGF